MIEKAFNLPLTKDFDLFALCYSETAEREGIVNLATEPDIIKNLGQLAANILQPIVDQLNLPVTITSGYRGPKLNTLVGGLANSQHCLGQAADILVGGLHCDELAIWIRDKLEFDQVILERYDIQNRHFGWVHCSYVSKEANRKQTLTFNGKEYLDGLLLVPVVEVT